MDTVDKIANIDSATARISILTSAIDHLLNIASAEWDFLSRAVCWPSDISNLSKGHLAQVLFQTQLAQSFKDAKDRSGFRILTTHPTHQRKGGQK